MKIIIDLREKSVIPLINALNDDLNMAINIEVSKLDLGDIIIQDDNDNNLLIIERKKLSDLAASIRDGRYAEQSFRLNGNSLHNHNIIYLIEGNINFYSDKYTKVAKNTLYTTMFSLNYFKGFSVLRTFDTKETSEFILLLTDKIRREKDKKGFYQPDYIEKQTNYNQVVKKVKKDNITQDNIGSILLSQIPGVSIKIAETIMLEYDSILELMKSLEKNNKCLDNLTYKTSSNMNKKISKTAIINILTYLIFPNKNTIKINT